MFVGMSEEMFDEGYQNITNIDISKVVVKAMNEKYKEKGESFKCEITRNKDCVTTSRCGDGCSSNGF